MAAEDNKEATPPVPSDKNPPAKKEPDTKHKQRPLIKIGGKLASEKESESPNTSWILEYCPGSDNLSMVVQVSSQFSMDGNGNEEFRMQINKEGLMDMIAWLFGVKNAIESVESQSS